MKALQKVWVKVFIKPLEKKFIELHNKGIGNHPALILDLTPYNHCYGVILQFLLHIRIHLEIPRPQVHHLKTHLQHFCLKAYHLY